MKKPERKTQKNQIDPFPVKGSGLSKTIPVLFILIARLLASISVLAFFSSVFAQNKEPQFLENFLNSTPVLPRNEIRALWITRKTLSSRDRIDRAVDFAVRGRFHILFVQVRGRGDAFYQSSLEPPGIELGEATEIFDPLAYILSRAHAAGIAVHAWVNVFYVWSDGSQDPPPGHVLRRHPDWLLVDEEGRRMDEIGLDDLKKRGVEGYFLSPANGDVRDYTLKVIEEVTSYDIDGVHLDYVRYPGPAYGYSTGERSLFALAYGVDPLEILHKRTMLAGIVGEEYRRVLYEELIGWRSRQVDKLVEGLRESLSDIPVSAAVVADPEAARKFKGQNWPGWVHRRNVDFVVLMAYNFTPPRLKEHVHYVGNVIDKGNFLVGLPLFGGRERYLEASIDSLRTEEVIGYSLFSYSQFEDEPFAIKFLSKVFWGEE